MGYKLEFVPCHLNPTLTRLTELYENVKLSMARLAATKSTLQQGEQDFRRTKETSRFDRPLHWGDIHAEQEERLASRHLAFELAVQLLSAAIEELANYLSTCKGLVRENAESLALTSNQLKLLFMNNFASAHALLSEARTTLKFAKASEMDGFMHMAIENAFQETVLETPDPPGTALVNAPAEN